jgi:hypothetical protein
LKVSARVDLRERSGSALAVGVWLRGERLIVEFGVGGDVTAPGLNGVVVWDLSRNSSTVYPSVKLWDISEDGSLALFRVDRGRAEATTLCLSVAPFQDTLAPSAKIVCGGSGLTYGLTNAHFSPDGTWVATEVNPTTTSTTVWLYRTADIAQGADKPIKIDDLYPTGHVRFVVWDTSTRLIVVEERYLAIKRCQVTGACQDLPGAPTQKPVGHIVNYDA